MDLYTTNALTRVVQQLIRPQSFLLDAFFPSVITEDSEEIHFDVERNKKRSLAPFVSPLIQGKVIEENGYETSTFKPAYVKMKSALDSVKPFKRLAGEQLTGSMSPQQRQAARVPQILADHLERLTRRQEVMAAEVLRTGKLTISGEGFHTQSLDFGRDASLTVTLTGGDRWGEAGVDPVKNIEGWALEMRRMSGVGISDVVMDVDAWELFRAAIDTELLFNNLRANTGANARTVLDDSLGAQFMGTDGVRRYYVYSDWFIDPADDTEKPILPSNTVLLSSSQLDGVRQFGAVKDQSLNFRTGEMLTKSWLENDPSYRVILSQSAPLVVPYRPNASMAVQVA